MMYNISRGGQQFGPYSLEDLKKYLAQGNVLPTDLAWAEGMPGWVPVSQVVGPPQPAAPAFRPPAPPAFQPAPAAFAPAGAAAYPAPPSMHWALVLVIGFVTCGIFPLIWLFLQAGFVKKIDRASNAIAMFIVGFCTIPVIFIFQLVLTRALISSGGREMMMIMPVFSMFVGFLPGIFFLIGIFRMRRSLINHYNAVEPINLRLSGVMTFFFNVYYFQYHLTRIANWKQTGVLA